MSAPAAVLPVLIEPSLCKAAAWSGDCRPPGSATPSIAAIALLAALLSGNWAVADASEVRERREASGLVAAFLQWHLERGLRSLPFVDRDDRKLGS